MNQPIPAFRSSRRGFLGLAAAATAGLALSACGGDTTTPGTDTSGGAAKSIRTGAAAEAFYIAGMQWAAPTNFNPLNGAPAFPNAADQPELIYEHLLRWNMLNNKLEPGLGKELKAVDDYTWEIPLQDGTKWNDGSELTADDAVFTFTLAKDAAVTYSTVWLYLDDVVAKDARTVVFTLKKDPYNPLFVANTIARTPILPKAYWSKLTNETLISDTNLAPIGSGPFKVGKYDQTQIVLTRDDAYWGKTVYGTPPMASFIHPIFKGNQDGDLKLETGDIDVSQQFTAQIWKMWEKGKPVSTWLKEKPYHIPGNPITLVINLSKKGLDNVGVRKALAYAINYPDIASKAISDYSSTVNASLILPEGSEAPFYDQAAVDASGWKYDSAKAIDILENELKCTKGSDGIYSLPDGTRLGPWKIVTPTGWTDWNTSCEIVAKSAQAVGIDLSTNFPQAPTLIAARNVGDFDIVHFGYSAVSYATPWARFRDALDDRGVAAIGKDAFWNWGRFADPAVPALLDAAAAEKDEAAAKAKYQELDEIFRKNIPCIPLMYRPYQFFQHNDGTWTNFPTKENAYAPPTFGGQGILWVFKVKRVGS